MANDELKNTFNGDTNTIAYVKHIVTKLGDDYMDFICDELPADVQCNAANAAKYILKGICPWKDSDRLDRICAPTHIDDRAPGMVVPDVAYATQEEIIDMANNGLLKVQAKN